MRNAIIFGAAGQDGMYLADMCRATSIAPVCVVRQKTNESQTEGNVSDRFFTKNLIKECQPLFVFHFAANSTTRHEALFENHETISTGTLNILEAIKLYSPHTKVLIVGSGVQFVNSGKPISEKDAFEAGNAYAIARIQSVYAARYFRKLGIKTYVAYLFHHESPYRKPHHVSKMITDKVKAILAGKVEKITIGDAGVQKEWGFAKDITEGMFTLINQDEIFEAAIGTGITHSIMDFMETCFAEAKLDMRKHVAFLSGFTPEYRTLVSNPHTIHQLGWQAKTGLRDLVKIMLH